jgi:hypothetical protein
MVPSMMLTFPVLLIINIIDIIIINISINNSMNNSINLIMIFINIIINICEGKSSKIKTLRVYSTSPSYSKCSSM